MSTIVRATMQLRQLAKYASTMNGRCVPAWGLLTVIVLAGCGSATRPEIKTTTPNDAPALTRAELINRARSACAEFTRAVRAMPDTVPADRSELESSSARFVDSIERFADTLHALTPPQRDRTVVQRYIKWIDRQVTLSKQFKAAGDALDSKTVNQLVQQLIEVMDQHQPYAGSIGLGRCDGGL